MRKMLKPFTLLSLFAPLIFAIPANCATEPPPAAPPAIAPAPPPPVAQGAARSIRLGYVDPARIGADSSFGKNAQARLKEKADKLTAQVEARKKLLEKSKAAIEAKLPTLNAKQRKSKAKEFEKQVVDYQEFARNAEKELQTMEREFTRQIAGQVEQAAAEFGKSGDYAAIMVKQELLHIGNGVEVKDVTDEIIKLVNEQGKK